MLRKSQRTSDTLIENMPIFQILLKTSLCIRGHCYSFEYGARCISNEIRLSLDKQTPMTKQEALPKGIGIAKFDPTKAFRNHN